MTQLLTKLKQLHGTFLNFPVEDKGVNPKNENLVEKVKELTNGRMADVVFEVTGNPDIIPQEFDVLKRQGKLVILSSPRGVTKNFDGSHPHYETPYNQWTQERHAELFFNLVADGELDVKSLISHRTPYTDAPELYDILLRDRTQAMGIIMEWV